MKCQKCGKNEINFHYFSKINDTIYERMLCSECAEKSGIDFPNLFKMTGDQKNQHKGFFPIPTLGFSMGLDGFRLMAGTPEQGAAGINSEDISGQDMPEESAPQIEFDIEMQKRREINTIRELMHLAATKEDYEEAARLRDQIKEMEKENSL